MAPERVRDWTMRYHVTLCLLVVVCVRSTGGLAGDPVLHPVNLSDEHGNSADGNSTISWGDMPAGGQYKADTSYSDGLSVYYDMMRGFVNVVQPNAFPIEMIQGVMGGAFDIGAEYMKIVMYALGFAITFVIGLFFLLIAPIVGCCFCCCRCCNNCGGKKMQKRKDARSCKRLVFSIASLCITGIMAVGLICTLLCNERLGDSMENLGPSIGDNLDDLLTFMDNVLNEVDVLVFGGYNFTTDVVTRDLNNIGVLLGVPARELLGSDGGIDEALDSVLVFDTMITNVGGDLVNVNQSITDLQDKGHILSSNLSDLVAAIQATCVLPCSFDTSGLQMDANFDELPDISSQMESLEDVQGNDLKALVEDGKKQFDDIPWRVQNDTENTVQSLIDMMGTYYTTMSNMLKMVTDMPKQTTGMIDPIRKDITTYTDYAKKYNTYRWYGMLGLGALVGIVVILQLLGTLFGVFGSKGSTPPMKRGCLSNSGGNMLMASTAFIFMFCSLLTLLTTILFLLGANMEKLLCQTIMDPEHTVLEQVLDGPDALIKGGDGGYLLGKMLFNNKSIPLTIGGIVDDCKADKAVYEAFMLESLIDTSIINNYKKEIDIDSEIDGIDVSLSDVEILSPATEQQLRDFSDAVQLNFTGFQDELEKNTTKVDLRVEADNIRAATIPAPQRVAMDAHADTLDAIADGSYNDAHLAQVQLLQDINTLNASASPIPVQVNDTIDKMRAAEDFIHINGTQMVKQAAKEYGVRIVDTIDSFVAHILFSLENNLAKCKPIYNFYTSMLEIALCKKTMDPLNGYWFGLGWCVFFMVPSMIFNVKLAKYFRKMKYDEDFSDPDDKPPPYIEGQSTNGGPPAIGRLSAMGQGVIIPRAHTHQRY